MGSQLNDVQKSDNAQAQQDDAAYVLEPTASEDIVRIVVAPRVMQPIVCLCMRDIRAPRRGVRCEMELSAYHHQYHGPRHQVRAKHPHLLGYRRLEGRGAATAARRWHDVAALLGQRASIVSAQARRLRRAARE